jgi:hypothetical protein
MMTRLVLLLAAATLAFGHTAEPAGAPPTELDSTVVSVLQKEGVRIKDGEKTVMELWFVQKPATAAPTSESNVSITTVPHGAFMGVVRFTQNGQDRRGQTMKPGLYTLRLSFFPPDGNHQGVADQRDFLILSPAAADKDVKATPDYAALMPVSMKASGTPHPAVLSIWKADAASFKPGVEKEGEHDYVLRHKIGDLPIALIVAGTFEH